MTTQEIERYMTIPKGELAEEIARLKETVALLENRSATYLAEVERLNNYLLMLDNTSEVCE